MRDFKLSKKNNYTKKDLVNQISSQIDIPKDKIKLLVDLVIENMSEIFIKKQSNTRLEIRNFGVFEIKKTKAKPKARNPKTNEVIFVPQRRKISFKAGKKIKDILNEEWNE